MATLEQVKTLEFIERKRKLAKSKKISVATYLSSGHAKYKSTLDTFISIGALSIVASCLGAIWATFGLATILYQSANMTMFDWIAAICEFVVYIVSIGLGIKLYRLDVTPNFALASLIILLVLNVVVFMGILPCFTVIFSIIGLVRWSTYKNWFNTITKSISKKQKAKDKTKTKTKPSDIEEYSLEEDEPENEDHKSSNAPWIIAIVLLGLLAIGGSAGFFFLGKDQGQKDGYSSGYSSGKNAGYQNGVSNGESSGYNRGYNNGYNDGYNTGYNDMWNKAMCIINGGGTRC